MRLIPKENGFLYVTQDAAQKAEDIKLTLDTNKKSTISFNGKRFQTFYQDMELPKNIEKEQYLKVKVRIYEGETFKEYVADTLPVTHIALIGRSIEDGYPHLASYVLKVAEETQKSLQELQRKIEEYKETGDLF